MFIFVCKIGTERLPMAVPSRRSSHITITQRMKYAEGKFPPRYPVPATATNGLIARPHVWPSSFLMKKILVKYF
jgi:hypothetical protein